MQETVETFVGLYTQTITEQAERLRQFTRMATHEWRQPLAPISTAVSLLRLPGLQCRAARANRRTDRAQRHQPGRHDLQAGAAREARWRRPTIPACRPCRSPRSPPKRRVSFGKWPMPAASRSAIADDMPSLIVDVGRLELALVNLLSNAIKYCDPAKPTCAGRSHRRGLEDGAMRNLRARQRHRHSARIASRTFSAASRAPTPIAPSIDAVTGVGLGLAIVDDCVIAMNGTITRRVHRRRAAPRSA